VLWFGTLLASAVLVACCSIALSGSRKYSIRRRARASPVRSHGHAHARRQLIDQPAHRAELGSGSVLNVMMIKVFVAGGTDIADDLGHRDRHPHPTARPSPKIILAFKFACRIKADPA
jgi:hypothetical protein